MLSRVWDLLFPEKCVLCQKVLEKGEQDLCRTCRMGLEAWHGGKKTIPFVAHDAQNLTWTHGNSDFLHGVDIPILLNSTPEQTRAHRRSRSRDGKTDSAFTTMVLEIEQAELDRCAHKAKIILAKTGENLTYAQYRAEMEG